MMNTELLDAERKQLFVQTHGSIFLPITGVFFWPILGVAGFFFSPQTICLTVFIIVLVLVPIAILFARCLVKKRLLISPLASLILPSLVPVFMSFGISIPLYFTNIMLVPLAFVLGLSLHWPVIAWLYNQYGFIVHSIVRVLIVFIIWYFFPTQLYTLLPISIGLLYLVTTVWLWLALHRAKVSL